LKIFPRHAAAEIALGEVLAKAGRWTDAIPALRAAIVLAPDIAALHRVLGSCLVHTGGLDEGIKELNGYLALYPNNAEAHYDLGAALRAKGKVDEAKAEFQTAHHLESGNLAFAAAANPAAFEPATALVLKREDGSVTANHYVNKALGFAFDIPAGWILPKTQKFDSGAEPKIAIAADDPTAPDEAAVARMRPVVLLTAVEKPSDQSSGLFTMTEYLTIYALAAQAGTSIESLAKPRASGTALEYVGTPQQVEIAGVKFVENQFRSHQRDRTMVCAEYRTVRKGYILAVQFYANDAESLERMSGSMKSLQFTDGTE